VIRVAIVDDHPIVRDGMVATFADGDIQVVGAVGCAADALLLVGRTHPDVAVVDLELPDANGEELIAALRRIEPAPYVVVFSAYAGEERVERAFSAGAMSYVRKGTPSDELLAVVRAAARGEARLPADIAAQLVSAMRAPRATRLTARERDILRLVASGRTNKAIAAALNISERTVKFHVGEILARLGATNRAQAVDIARENGIL
jgi:two-component system NarL family response regulator